MAKKSRSQRLVRDIRQVARRGVVGAALLARDRKTRKRYKKKLGSRLSPKSSTSFTMERCSANLLKAALDPFAMIDDVCIPYGNGRPSQKIRSLQRGSGFIGTSGVGYICVSPSCTTDNRLVSFSTENYAGSTMTVIAGTGVGSSVTTTGYGASYFDPAAAPYVINQFRLCAVGLRIKYTGTELNKSGQVYALSTPDRLSMQNYGLTDISKFAECQISNFGRGWTTIGCLAQEDNEWDYSPAEGCADTKFYYPWSGNLTYGTTPIVGAPVMGMLITGVIGQPFAWEVVSYSEVIGPSVQGLTSRNAVDIDGLGKAVSVASKVPAMIASGVSRAKAIAESIAEVANMTNSIVGVTASMFS